MKLSASQDLTADPAATHAWCRALFAQLAMCGVKHVAVSPGSRSTPLTVAADQTEGIELSMHLDERSGGFFALGLARASNRPVALLCTSGTAAANYLPAVVEAFHYGVPLVVLTADRPPELQGVGAPQAIEQQDLYGSHVRWTTTTAVAGIEAPIKAASIAHKATLLATGPAPGPVHVNVPLREPLEPPDDDPSPFDLLPLSPRNDSLNISELDLIFGDGMPERGLLVAGPMDTSANDRQILADLACVTGWPLLADSTSGLRRGPHVKDAPVLAMGDHLLRSSWSNDHRPDLVVQVGSMPTSKGYHLWLDQIGVKRLVAVDHLGRFPDAALKVTDKIAAHPGRFARHLVDHLSSGAKGVSEWTIAWTSAEKAAIRAVNQVVDRAPFDEPGVITSLDRGLPDAVELVVGNSMPIRDVDAFLATDCRSWSIRGNRGANGIDGLVSTATGIAAHSDVPTILLAGDLTFLHDLGGLTAVRRLGVDLTAVVMDNDGGGIFSFLPISEEGHVDHHRLFHTPHGLDLGRAADLANASLFTAGGPKQLETALGNTVGRPGLHIIHIRTDALVNVSLHRKAAEAVDQALTEPVS